MSSDRKKRMNWKRKEDSREEEEEKWKTYLRSWRIKRKKFEEE